MIINRIHIGAQQTRFYPNFHRSSVTHIQAVVSKAGIIRTESAFEGIIFKGVGKRL
jgi:lipoprotein-releasing system permease protein